MDRSILAFFRTLNIENQTSTIGLMFKILQKAGTEIYSFQLKYNSFEKFGTPEKSQVCFKGWMSMGTL